MIRPSPRPAGRDAKGFTLVEVLVALAIMALMAVLAWGGLDGMQRARERTQAISHEVLALQAGLAQWQSDLDAVLRVALVGGMDYDGRTLRLARYDRYSVPAGPADVPQGSPWGGGSLRVVAWTVRVTEGRRQWLRWQSPPLTQRAGLIEAWRQAALWGQNPDEAARAREVVVADVDDWQIYYYRDNAWSSPQSSALATGTSGDAAQTRSQLAALPDGVRLVLRLSAGQALSGELTRDWASATRGAGG